MPPETHGSSKPAVKIVIADDHPLIRKIVTSTLNSEPGFKVIAEAQDGLEAVQKVEELRPDVVVLNITMPVMDGFEAARRIHRNHPKIPIVILSSDVDQRFVDEARKIAFTHPSRSQDLFRSAGLAMKLERYRMVLLNQTGDRILQMPCNPQGLQPEASESAAATRDHPRFATEEEGVKYYMLALLEVTYLKSLFYGTSMKTEEEIVEDFLKCEVAIETAYPGFRGRMKNHSKDNGSGAESMENSPNLE